MLEAAAIFSTNIQGRSYFSRPHLMRLVISLDIKTPISREEALRGFGQLLRSGRIHKVLPGRFALSDHKEDGLQFG